MRRGAAAAAAAAERPQSGDAVDLGAARKLERQGA
jgi:hypothetical protein